MSKTYENQKEITYKKYGKTKKHPNVSIITPNVKKFRVDFKQYNYNPKFPTSAKPTSYGGYNEHLLQNYYDNFNEVLDPYDFATVEKLDNLRKYSNFKEYNDLENGYPNATIEAYVKFLNSTII